MKKNKIDIITSANCLIIQNVTIETHKSVKNKNSGVITFENIIIAPNTKMVIPGQVEESEAHLLYDKECQIGPIKDFEEKFVALLEREIMTPSNQVPLRLKNSLSRAIKIKTGTKLALLLPLDNFINGKCLMLTTSDTNLEWNEIKSKTPSDSSSILSKLKKEKLTQLLFKHAAIIFRGATDFGRTEVLGHKIDTGKAAPIRMVPRRIPYFQQPEVKQDLQSKEAAGIIKK